MLLKLLITPQGIVREEIIIRSRFMVCYDGIMQVAVIIAVKIKVMFNKSTVHLKFYSHLSKCTKLCK